MNKKNQQFCWFFRRKFLTTKIEIKLELFNIIDTIKYLEIHIYVLHFNNSKYDKFKSI